MYNIPSCNELGNKMFLPSPTVKDLVEALADRPELLQQIIAARTLIGHVEPIAADFKVQHGFATRIGKMLVRTFPTLSEHQAQMIIDLVCDIDVNETNIALSGLGGSSVTPIKELVVHHIDW